MKKYILVIVYLFQLSTPASAINIKSDENIEIIHISDTEVIYSVLNDEEIEFWHYDIIELSNVPLAVKKPYLKDSILSYKKIESIEVFTIENKELNNACELWVHFEKVNTLAVDNARCNTEAISLSDNKIYIPLKPIYIPGVDGGVSNSLISYDLFTKSITVEFDSLEHRLDGLDDYTSYAITDIEHLSKYTIIKLHESMFERSWLIKLDKTHQATPNILAFGSDGYDGSINIIVSDKLYISIVNSVYYSSAPTKLFKFNETSGELEQIFDSVETDHNYVSFYNYKDELLAITRTNGLRSLYRVLENGELNKLGDLPDVYLRRYVSNEQILYRDSFSDDVYKLKDDYSSEFLFELNNSKQDMILAENLIFFFNGYINPNSNEIGIYNQEEGISKLILLATQIESPEISGLPATVVTANEYYEFIPEIYDPLSIPLELTIENKPSWATFDSITGAITGNPIEVSQHDNIIISVSNGYLEESLPAFSIQVLEAKSIEKNKSSGGAIFFLVFIIGISSLLRISTMRTV